jgi:hypothetical protein
MHALTLFAPMMNFHLPHVSAEMGLWQVKHNIQIYIYIYKTLDQLLSMLAPAPLPQITTLVEKTKLRQHVWVVEGGLYSGVFSLSGARFDTWG